MKKISNARFELLFSMYGTDGLIQEENVYSISEAIKKIKNLIKNKKHKQLKKTTMAIIATNEGGQGFATLEAGTYPARCVSMVHIGTIEETIAGKTKTLNKVSITWELPTELKEFKQGDGEKPYHVRKEYTLSMNEKSNLRKDLKSWRGKDFTEEEAKNFDVTKLIGIPCMLSVTHKESGGKTYLEVTGVSPLMKGFTIPNQITPSFELSYDNFSMEKFMTLPEFIRKKMEKSLEFKPIEHANQMHELESRSQTPNGIDNQNSNDNLAF